MPLLHKISSEQDRVFKLGRRHSYWMGPLGASIANTKHRILGASGAAAAPAHKHRPLLAVLGAFLACGVFLVLRWRKPKTRIIYDLEKGRYIITRISWRCVLRRWWAYIVQFCIKSSTLILGRRKYINLSSSSDLIILRAWVQNLWFPCHHILGLVEAQGNWPFDVTVMFSLLIDDACSCC